MPKPLDLSASSTQPSPSPGDLQLRPQRAQEGSRKIVHRVYRAVIAYSVISSRVVWRMTLFRLEWFPRLKTWRLIETVGKRTISGTTRWEQHTLIDFGDVSEHDVCAVACSSLRLLGKP